MTVIAYDPYASEEKARAVGVTLVTLDEALAQGDFFSLHMPLTPGDRRGDLVSDEGNIHLWPGRERVIDRVVQLCDCIWRTSFQQCSA